MPISAEAASGAKSINLDATKLRPGGTWSSNNDKVYFGQYDGNPLAYRVLDSSSGTQTVVDSLLLDCDSVIANQTFNNYGNNKWPNSDLESWLNSNNFYGNTGVFSSVEKNAIAKTSLTAQASYSVTSAINALDYASEDFVFVLSAKEMLNLYSNASERLKYYRGDTTSKDWWTRSQRANDTGV
ncbi:MAG: DUF6273 domain-containing protein, partial [Lachnospiraceae bacterium]